MKMVAISRILDEADIVEAFVRHTSTYAQHHIILDNGSTDGTIDILRALSGEGISLSVYQNLSVSFSEQAFMTFMFKEAVKTHHADWVICLDGDEFIDDRHLPGGLTHFLDSLKDMTTCVRIPWTQYQYTRSDDKNEAIVPKRIVHRTDPVDDYKVVVKSDLIKRDIVIDNGGHGIYVDGQHPVDVPIVQGVYLAHYSERSPFQTVVKFTRGWVKAKAAGHEITSRNVSWHYKGPFEALRDRPSELLRSDWFMNFKNESPDLKKDPIEYRGGELRYTPSIDPAMLAVRSLAGYLEALGDRHGVLIDTFAEVRNFVEQGNKAHRKII